MTNPPPSRAGISQTPSPRVSLAVCGIFHYRKYVGELSTRGGLLDFFYSHRLSTTAHSLGIVSGRAVNLWMKEYLYRGARVIGGARGAALMSPLAHGIWDEGVARRIRPGDFFHGMLHGTLMRSFARARAMGQATIGEPVNSHPDVLQEILEQEHEILGLPPPRDLTTLPAVVEELPGCDYLVCGSRLIRDTYVSRGFPADRTTVIPYGIDTAHFYPLSPAERATHRDGRFRVICVAQIVPRKGIHYLLEAWERLGLPSAEAELVLVGPPCAEMAGVLARHAGRFTHLGSTPHDRLRLEYGRSDVFVLPSVEDGFGYVTTEAMGCGLPVITTSACGSADIVEDGISGFVVRPRSVDDLVDRLERLRVDPDLRREMGERSLEASRVTRSWATYVDGLDALYRRLHPARAGQ
jgi:hypothetical protein